MSNNFNFNYNKIAMECDEFSQTTISGDFANDYDAYISDGLPNDSPTPITYTVTFDNSDNNGTSSTYTANALETIGSAIEEKALTVTSYYPTYIFNEGIVDKDCQIKIKENITIYVKWTSID